MSDLFMNMQRRRSAAVAHRVNSMTSSNDTSPGGNSSLQSSITTAAVNDQNEEVDEFANFLSLKLRKPKHWNWELTTSRSCSNIALPRIMLYDHMGTLLVDANTQEAQTYRPIAETKHQSRPAMRKCNNKAATANLAQSIRQVLDQQFNGLHIQEATPSAISSCTNTATTTPTTNNSGFSTIDFYSNELPDYKIHRRANSLKGVRFKEDHDKNSTANGLLHMVDLPTPPSTTTTTTTATPTNSSSSGPREKRRCRRSHSSGRSPATSESILERFSFNKGRFSSPEYPEEHEVYHAPRYFLRTCKAGTIVVQKESFSRLRTRRRPRHSSSENVLQNNSSKGSLNTLDTEQTHLKVPGQNGVRSQSGSLQNVTEQKRKKVFPVRRYRSDGNMLLRGQQSTSEDEEDEKEKTNQVTGGMKPAQRKYTGYRRQSKKDMVTIDSDNRVHPFDSPTAR